AFKRLLTNGGSNGESGESSQSINDAATREKSTFAAAVT
ncbi:hypothetical protein Z583_03061, partial [Mycobacterium tuberculosis variant bovis Bz 31150]